MRTTYVTPVIVLLAAVSLTNRSSSVQAAAQAAADECVSKPGTTAPQGSHWYYRVNRADGRHCWYLGPEGSHVRPAMSATRVTRMPRRIAQRPVDQRPVDQRPVEVTAAQTASADPTPTRVAPADTTVGANDAAPEFDARWIDLPSALDASRRRQASMIGNSYSEEHAAPDPQDDMPLVWPILTPDELAAAEAPPPRSLVKWEYILGSLALVLALAARLIGTVPGAEPARPETASASSRLTRLLRRAAIHPRSEGPLRRPAPQPRAARCSAAGSA
jgi:hypothetical protein